MNGTPENDEEKKVLGYDFQFHIPGITEYQAAIDYDINILLARLWGTDDIGGSYHPLYDYIGNKESPPICMCGDQMVWEDEFGEWVCLNNDCPW